jgi:hypothetical protein
VIEEDFLFVTLPTRSGIEIELAIPRAMLLPPAQVPQEATENAEVGETPASTPTALAEVGAV